jgi:Protein of unknown function (DUF2752)
MSCDDLDDPRQFAEIVRAAVPPALIATTTGVLLRFPPAQNSFYPRCPIYDLLHLQCPGCGATRALAALLHGHFNEAMHLNGLTTLLLPVGVICGIRWYCRFVRREVDHWPQVPRVALYAALAAAMMFTVVRNLLLGHFR